MKLLMIFLGIILATVCWVIAQHTEGGTQLYYYVLMGLSITAALFGLDIKGDIMVHKWSNKNRLKDLKVGTDNGNLTFNYKDEEVVVYLKGVDIHKVSHKKGGEITTIKEPYKLVRGKENAEREVWHYLKPGGPSPMMRLGITYHKKRGNWSSTPHPFELKPEKGFEEVFFYLLDGDAIHVGRGLWANGSKADDIWRAKDHTWATVPMGYHPIVGEPDTMVSYVWCYICKKKEWEKI